MQILYMSTCTKIISEYHLNIIHPLVLEIEKKLENKIDRIQDISGNIEAIVIFL